jgi:uncharacterized protein (TIGR02594 family)
MNYDWLLLERSPKLLVSATKLIGVSEVVGRQSNPTIIAWAKATQLQAYYTNDDIPWCGLFIAYCCHINSLDIVKQPLWALSWSNWGTAAEVAMLGDVLVFKRKGGGHVGIYVGEDKDCYHVLGGNQGDKVSIVRIHKNRLYAARRTKWRIAQPTNVRRVYLSSEGKVSVNEQ